MEVFIVKEGKEMKAKQVLEMSDRLKTKRERYEILLQKSQITSVQMKFYQKEQKDLYIKSRQK